jgi:dTDP-4-dehydrorhamnose 3,5-epimerase
MAYSLVGVVGRDGTVSIHPSWTEPVGVVAPASGWLVCASGVWHGLRNLEPARSTVVNIVDRAYEYEALDHWRLPADSPEIPYSI